MKRIVFFAGAAAGYVLGTRAGQQRYDQMRTKAEQLWSSQQVQDKVETARRTLSERAPGVAEKVGAATKSAGGRKGGAQGADGGETIDLSAGDMGAGPLGSATLGQGVPGNDPVAGTGTGGDRLP